MIDEIIDHCKSHRAVHLGDEFITSPTGVRKRKKTTLGWDICVLWKDGTSSWVSLKDMKTGYPVELAEYARLNHIDNEPAFTWWVPYTLKKRSAIINNVKSKYWQRTHKYGIRIPKTIQEALAIDKENNNSFWHDAIKQEMPKIINALEEFDGTIQELLDDKYKKITGHMMFDSTLRC